MSERAEIREFVAGAQDAGLRLDVLLSNRLPGWSRSQLQKLIRSGRVQMGSRAPRKAGEMVEPGEQISVRLEWQATDAAAEALPLDIIYQNDDFAVINKRAGMVVHAGAGVSSGTVVNALLYHMPSLSSAGGSERPGIVHRLDKMTSGVMLVAKNNAAHRGLAAAFKSREIQKTYIALVHGRVKSMEGTIDSPIGRDRARRVRMKTGGAHARSSLTHYRVLRRYERFTLLEVLPRTGRTHQIRVHLASIGHAVAGDTIYGSPSRARDETRVPLGRMFLHASALAFRSPNTGEPVKFEAPLPEDLRSYLSNLDAEL